MEKVDGAIHQGATHVCQFNVQKMIDEAQESWEKELAKRCEQFKGQIAKGGIELDQQCKDEAADEIKDAGKNATDEYTATCIAKIKNATSGVSEMGDAVNEMIDGWKNEVNDGF